jgi:hypothetical protein
LSPVFVRKRFGPRLVPATYRDQLRALIQ